MDKKIEAYIRLYFIQCKGFIIQLFYLKRARRSDSVTDKV